MDDAHFSGLEALNQPVFAIVVEKEADRAAVHAIDRDAAIEVTVHGLQHQPVAAQRHDSISGLRGDIAVALNEGLAGGHRLFGLARHEGDI